MGLWRTAIIAGLLLAAPLVGAQAAWAQDGAHKPDAATATGPAPTAEPLRIALVIGNSDYNLDGRTDTPAEVSTAAGYANDLRNPVTDASDMAEALTRLHFKVTPLLNGTREQMELTLAKFGAEVAKAGPNDIVVVYYSGHGIQIDGVNFLIPVGAKIPTDQDLSGMPPESARTVISSYTVSLDDVFAQLRKPGAHGLNLIILDACRDNPWESRLYGGGKGTFNGQAGLAQARTTLARTLIAFATSPGQQASDGKGRHSPYTDALLTWMEAPDLDVLHMLNRVGLDVDRMTGQTPWMNNAPVAEICLAGCAEHSNESHKAAPALNQVADAHEGEADTAFRDALQKFTVEDLQAYVKKYPGGANAETARNVIVKLQGLEPSNKH
jgi:uncharacterized caspase-like protein